jgi:hypothetical protein
MSDTTVIVEQEFIPISLTEYKNQELKRLIIKAQNDETIQLACWAILSTREASLDIYHSIAEYCNNDFVALAAYNRYMTMSENPYFVIYYINNTLVALQAAKDFINGGNCGFYDYRKLINGSKIEELALFVYKEFCKKYNKHQDFESYLFCLTQCSGYDKRFESVAILAYKKLVKLNVLSPENLVTIAKNGRTLKIRLDAVKLLIAKKNERVNVTNLKHIFTAQDQNDSIRQVIYNRIEELVIDNPEYDYSTEFFYVLSHNEMWNKDKWLIKIWNLAITYSPFTVKDLVKLFQQSNQTIQKLIWTLIQDDSTLTRYDYYNMREKCYEPQINKAIRIAYINLPADKIGASDIVSMMNRNPINFDVIRAGLEVLSTLQDQEYYNRCIRDFTTQVHDKDQLYMWNLYKTLPNLTDKNYLQVTKFSNNHNVATAAFKLYLSLHRATQQDLIEIIQHAKVKKVLVDSIFLLSETEELTTKQLKVLASCNDDETSKFYWNQFINHNDTSVYDIEETARSNDSWKLKNLARDTLQTPYYKSFQLQIAKYKDD